MSMWLKGTSLAALEPILSKQLSMAGWPAMHVQPATSCQARQLQQDDYDARNVWNHSEVVALKDLQHLLYLYRFPRKSRSNAAKDIPVLTPANSTAMSGQPLSIVKAILDERYMQLRAELRKQLQYASWAPTSASLIASAAGSLLRDATSALACQRPQAFFLPGVQKMLHQHMHIPESNDGQQFAPASLFALPCPGNASAMGKARRALSARRLAYKPAAAECDGEVEGESRRKADAAAAALLKCEIDAQESIETALTNKQPAQTDQGSNQTTPAASAERQHSQQETASGSSQSVAQKPLPQSKQPHSEQTVRPRSSQPKGMDSTSPGDSWDQPACHDSMS